jgi:hypothetical protein
VYAYQYCSLIKFVATFSRWRLGFTSWGLPARGVGMNDGWVWAYLILIQEHSIYVSSSLVCKT